VDKDDGSSLFPAALLTKKKYHFHQEDVLDAFPEVLADDRLALPVFKAGLVSTLQNFLSLSRLLLQNKLERSRVQILLELK